MSADLARPRDAAVIGPHVIVSLRAAAAWAPALRNKLDEARARGEHPWPYVLDVAAAFTQAERACDSERQRTKAPVDLSFSDRSHSAPQVAELAGVSEQAVRLAAREGRLPGRRVGRNWIFDGKDVERWIEARSA